MAKKVKPRSGSLQFWPRKRTRKALPSVNWNPLESSETKNKLLGFIGYKVGMVSAIAKDNTLNSLTKGKKIILPVTVLECPPMKVLAVRFYKNEIVALDVYSSDLGKELKRKILVPKKISTNIEEIGKNLGNYDNVRLLVYTLAKQTNIKKTPDITEIGLKGTIEEKFNLAKSFLNKEIRISDVFSKTDNVDVHGTTKGHGFTGSIKRFGIGLKSHKTEKGVRRPGSLGPWHPNRVTYLAPMAGQMGFFSRSIYNNKIIEIAKITEKNINPSSGFKHYGVIKTDYIMIKGSVQGPAKRAVLMTSVLRPSKITAKQNFELVGVEK